LEHNLADEFKEPTQTRQFRANAQGTSGRKESDLRKSRPAHRNGAFVLPAAKTEGTVRGGCFAAFIAGDVDVAAPCGRRSWWEHHII